MVTELPVTLFWVFLLSFGYFCSCYTHDNRAEIPFSHPYQEHFLWKGNAASAVDVITRGKDPIFKHTEGDHLWSQNELLCCPGTMAIKHMQRLPCNFSESLWISYEIHFSGHWKIYEKNLIFSHLNSSLLSKNTTLNLTSVFEQAGFILPPFGDI